MATNIQHCIEFQ